ncbi:MAG TPA: CPBP family intramembrane metalloprotease [Cyanobacteria bacterium UBA11149]|nr:CPBP family intramembrane metalloprotease [Cyanobacteria bacterium UBA11366]HBR75595.1 CPBP family intramembrane metalloprotease [Cyanobacteria bacterium UBA11159]HBW88309.1 CPBP family intramembrane metalloprotease [Cyanobacteria bacterium UBA11149]HCA94463.1 CPBP family intramembrane metalloprotease [Cyanobacteria bacterium UBA9226]
MTTLVLCWLPIAAPIYLLVKDSNLVTILTMGLLFGYFLLLVQFWGINVYHERKLLKRYGCHGTKKNGLNLVKGLTIGLLFTLGLFSLECGLGWLKFQTPSPELPKIILEGLASGLGVGLAEELVFRGWLLDELERDYSPKVSLWADGVIFGMLHFLKPISEMIRTLPQFPGLVLLGLTLVWAKRSHRNSLGISIGLHGGLVWGYYIINVGKLVEYSDRVSPWITGVDSNPIAGLMGLLLLGILAFWMRGRGSRE